MDACSMTAAIHPGWDCALTARLMTRMTSLTYILLLNFVSNIGFAFSYNHNKQVDIKFAGRLSTRFRV